jgi:Fur family ferric uptake transcriptional regulator
LLGWIIAAGGEHLSADALLEQVAGSDPPIHRATVYRTLEGLTSAGVLRHVHLDRGLTAYHLVDAPPVANHRSEHLHAQCSVCGAVTDLPAHVLGDTAERIRRATGFRLDASHVALSGTCRNCAAPRS